MHQHSLHELMLACTRTGCQARPGEWHPYALAQHSGPWHLREAIAGSRYMTTDMEQADIVYVYDHCYYMLWLAQVAFPVRCPPNDPRPSQWS